MSKMESRTLLVEFLDNFEPIPVDLVNKLLKITSDENEKNIINALAPTLINQFKESKKYLMDLSVQASKQSLNEVETFLKISSGISLAKNIKILLPSIPSPVGIIGLVKIIEQIKKVLEKIFELLSITLPKWVILLIDLIDEIINAMLSLGSLKMSNILSRLEVNYLAELTQVAKLEKAKSGIEEELEEEN
jgi:hypothetical protein